MRLPDSKIALSAHLGLQGTENSRQGRPDIVVSQLNMRNQNLGTIDIALGTGLLVIMAQTNTG